MSTERTPYQRNTDRRRARAQKLIADLRGTLDSVEKHLQGGVSVPDAALTPSATRLDQTLQELSTLEELAEEMGIIPPFAQRLAEAQQQRTGGTA